MLKIGIQIPHVWHWSGPAAVDAVIDRAEELGYDSLWTADHIVIPESIGANYPYNEAHTFGPGGPGPWPWLDPFAMLSYAAGRTRRVALGTAVLIVPYRRPLVTAKLAAGVDALSNGRLILGVGAGWMEEEFRALGIGDQYAVRGRVTDEYLRVMKTVWGQDIASFSGEFASFERVSALPRPVQQPNPPIWIGGTSKAAMRRVARLGDGWLAISLPPEDVAERVEVLGGMMREAGRDPAELTIGLHRRVVLARTSAEAKELRERDGGRASVGTPDEVAAQFRAYAAAGVQHVNVTGGGRAEVVLDLVERFSRDVLPALRAERV